MEGVGRFSWRRGAAVAPPPRSLGPRGRRAAELRRVAGRRVVRHSWWLAGADKDLNTKEGSTMKSRLTATGRRRLSGVVVVAIFALVAAGVSQGGATPSTAKSPVYNHRDECTNDPAVHPVGTATFTRDKNILT